MRLIDMLMQQPSKKPSTRRPPDKRLLEALPATVKELTVRFNLTAFIVRTDLAKFEESGEVAHRARLGPKGYEGYEFYLKEKDDVEGKQG